MKSRSSGILMHISSLPTPYGIGTLGEEAYRFVDFLKNAGQKYWQILPIGPTGFRDSPYQSFSTNAGNPYFIDLDILCREELLRKEEYQDLDFGEDEERVNYQKIFSKKLPVLKKAHERSKTLLNNEMQQYRRGNHDWIEDYALFMAVKEYNQMKSWQEWQQDIRVRKPREIQYFQRLLQDEVDYWIFLQYIFDKQWKELKQYANNNGIKIIGDIPIYVALDSVDTWANNEIFYLDEDRRPLKISGCPPDSFSTTGQLWGNPIYRWNVLEENEYEWWVNRVKKALDRYDVVRIDHFRGFEAYWEIPFGDITAEKGQWIKGPGKKFFQVLQQSLGKENIIAEDLGFITDEVNILREDLGYPGMKVLQFAFDTEKDSVHIPHNYDKHCVVYTGTHDNDTINGWLQRENKFQKERAIDYLKLNPKEGYHWGCIRGVWSSVADLSIAPMQDFLGLGSEARMNTPSTIEDNWQWRIKNQDLTEELSNEILHITRLYERVGVEKC